MLSKSFSAKEGRFLNNKAGLSVKVSDCIVTTQAFQVPLQVRRKIIQPDPADGFWTGLQRLSVDRRIID